jgi:hypothetical protein
MSFLATYKSEGFSPDGLVAQNAQLLLSEPVTLLAGQNLKRGALLGKVTASGKYVLSLAAAADGSQVPVAILVEDIDASAGDKAALAYTRGDFNAQALTLGAGHTVASVKAALANLGIFLINNQGGV